MIFSLQFFAVNVSADDEPPIYSKMTRSEFQSLVPSTLFCNYTQAGGNYTGYFELYTNQAYAQYFPSGAGWNIEPNSVMTATTRSN